jgi:hypothetical protein
VVAPARQPLRAADGRRGVATFLSSLQWANEAFPYTIGLAFDLLPAALFLHVFLAFPSGRLQRRLERIAVAAAYSAAVGLQLVKMRLGRARADNLVVVVTEPAAANTVHRPRHLFGGSAHSGADRDRGPPEFDRPVSPCYRRQLGRRHVNRVDTRH